MFDESFDVFFEESEFAVTATVDGQSMSVIFDAAYAMGDVGPYGMSSVAPIVTLPTAKVPADPIGKSVVVNGKSYLVTVHQPDGTGVSTLTLEAAT